ncbi:MAG: glycosyltransferase family 2 protein [Myxococcota bacterium]
MNERVAVVVLNYAGADDTIRCVESLRAQRVRPEWVVVVDNASPDDSAARLSGLGPDVTFLQSGANLGFAGGNNVGVRWALEQGADAVWLLNNDAIAEQGALEALLRTWRAHPRAGAIGTLIFKMDRPGELQCWGGGWINLWTGRAREFDFEVPDAQLDYVSGCSLFLPRAALEAAGLLDEGFFMYFEDAELSLRYRARGFELSVARDAVVHHKGGASVRPGRRQLEWRTQSLLRVLKLHASSYLGSVALSTALRAASMLARRQAPELRGLVEDVARFLRAPDWRHR